MSSNELAGKVALVTGGSRGIGAEVARKLAGAGAAVAITYVQAADQAGAVVKQIEAAGGTAIAIRADLAASGDAEAAVARTIGELGRLDVLVNNAGHFTYGALHEVTTEELDRVLAIDVRSVFLAAQAAARQMADGGRIISIGSCFNGRVPGDSLVLQATAKAALIGLTKGLARELGSRGITSNVVDPGPIDTDMNPADGETADFQAGLTALGRYGKVEDIADTVLFLAGPTGNFITGAAIPVDGGYTV
ncbi:SDR family oxidoreductase [Kitasatospora sp. NPDC006697]|uniref:SDR family oxidoreductase n=1 Tax=Kitasatospora sp. NPDC006697 TaxID=3364020 RepID=UPI0036742194